MSEQITADNDDRLSDGSKERIKLRSTYINGIALSILSIGVFAPVAAWIFFDRIKPERLYLGLAFVAFCFVASYGLHFLAQANLRELDK